MVMCNNIITSTAVQNLLPPTPLELVQQSQRRSQPTKPKQKYTLTLCTLLCTKMAPIANVHFAMHALTVLAALSKSSTPIIFKPLPSIRAFAFLCLLPELNNYDISLHKRSCLHTSMCTLQPDHYWYSEVTLFSCCNNALGYFVTPNDATKYIDKYGANLSMKELVASIVQSSYRNNLLYQWNLHYPTPLDLWPNGFSDK